MTGESPSARKPSKTVAVWMKLYCHPTTHAPTNSLALLLRLRTRAAGHAETLFRALLEYVEPPVTVLAMELINFRHVDLLHL